MNASQLIDNRSTLLIFRDCLKLAARMVDDPIKCRAVRQLIKRQFKKNQDVLQAEKIKLLKLNAVKGITNYLIHNVQQQFNIKPAKTIYDTDEVAVLQDEADEDHGDNDKRDV